MSRSHSRRRCMSVKEVRIPEYSNYMFRSIRMIQPQRPQLKPVISSSCSRSSPNTNQLKRSETEQGRYLRHCYMLVPLKIQMFAKFWSKHLSTVKGIDIFRKDCDELLLEEDDYDIDIDIIEHNENKSYISRSSENNENLMVTIDEESQLESQHLFHEDWDSRFFDVDRYADGGYGDLLLPKQRFNYILVPYNIYFMIVIGSFFGLADSVFESLSSQLSFHFSDMALSVTKW